MEVAARKTLADLHVTTVRSIRQPVSSLSVASASPLLSLGPSCGTRSS